MNSFQLKWLMELSSRCEAIDRTLKTVYARINDLEGAGFHESQQFRDAAEDWRKADCTKRALLAELKVLVDRIDLLTPAGA